MAQRQSVDGERTSSTGQRLLEAALECFSTLGFEGASARRIERLAGVERGLVSYHFGSKQNLWNEAVDRLYGQFTKEVESLRDALRDVAPHERGVAMLMAYARFNARNPAFFRILVLEGYVQTERSERLAGHLRRTMTMFSEVTAISIPMPLDTAIRWFQLLGAAGAMFALPAHAKPTFGELLYDPQFIDRSAALFAAIYDPATMALDAEIGERTIHFFGDTTSGRTAW
jgi:AcrR family transcriptional regulator